MLIIGPLFLIGHSIVLGVTNTPRGMTATYLAVQLNYAQALGSC
jgi:hypothetical protein